MDGKCKMCLHRDVCKLKDNYIKVSEKIAEFGKSAFDIYGVDGEFYINVRCRSYMGDEMNGEG